MKFRTISSVAAGAIRAGAVLASGAQAATVFTEDFDGEFGGKTHLNYAGLANWDISEGTIDLKGVTHKVKGDGSYVELDGTSLNGGFMTTRSSFAFNAGDIVTLSFDASGNQQRKYLMSNDDLVAGFVFGGATALKDYTLGGGFGPVNLGNFNVAKTSNDIFLDWRSVWQPYTISFKAGAAGTLKLYVGTHSDDNYGPLVDNFKLSVVTAVPEPATWAMMILGFAMTGAMVRTRRGAMIA